MGCTNSDFFLKNVMLKYCFSWLLGFWCLPAYYVPKVNTGSPYASPGPGCKDPHFLPSVAQRRWVTCRRSHSKCRAMTQAQDFWLPNPGLSTKPQFLYKHCPGCLFPHCTCDSKLRTSWQRPAPHPNHPTCIQGTVATPPVHIREPLFCLISMQLGTNNSPIES